MADGDNGTKKLLNVLGQIVAILMLIQYACMIIDAYVPFLPKEGIIPQIFSYLTIYGTYALMILVGLSAIWDKPFLIKLVFLAVCALIVIFTFIPSVREKILEYINLNKGTTPPAPEASSFWFQL